MKLEIQHSSHFVSTRNEHNIYIQYKPRVDEQSIFSNCGFPKHTFQIPHIIKCFGSILIYNVSIFHCTIFCELDMTQQAMFRLNVDQPLYQMFDIFNRDLNLPSEEEIPSEPEPESGLFVEPSNIL